MIRLLLAGLFYFLCHNLTAQITGHEQDCDFATTICSRIINFSSPYEGTGVIYDEIDSFYECSTNEDNSVWLYFEIDSPGLLEFIIEPTDTFSSDFDFTLYKVDSLNCFNIRNNNQAPVRCNFSAQGDTLTGLLQGYTDTIGNAGAETFLAPLPVNSNDKYILLINNFLSPQSFRLSFVNPSVTFKKPNINSIVQNEIRSMSCNNASYIFDLLYPQQCNLINRNNIQVIGPGNFTVSNVRNSRCHNNQTKEIEVTFSGNLITDSTYYLVINLPDSTFLNTLFFPACKNSFVLKNQITYPFTYDRVYYDTLDFEINEYTLTTTPLDYTADTISNWPYNYFLPSSPSEWYFHQNSNLIIFPTSGNKTMCIVGTDGCYSETVCKTFFIDFGNSIIESPLNQILSIHPNPVKDVLTIELTDSHHELTVEVFDIISNAIMLPIQLTASTNTIHFTNHPNGIYFININDAAGNRTTRKIMVMH